MIQPRHEIRYIRVSPPIGDFYIASIPADVLRQISISDVRRLQQHRDVEEYLGIERPLSDKRVADLWKYVNSPDATFPTSIILAIDENCVDIDEERRLLTLHPFEGDENIPPIDENHIAHVLDGQHRIAGLERFDGERFELNITVFIGADLSDQAAIFSTVNLEQTKVNKSLAYDLFELAKSRSPEKTCHNTAVVLDTETESPFFKRIKRLGVATPGRARERITQATFVQGLLPFITDDPITDRIEIKKGRKLRDVTGSALRRMPFRNYFVRDEDQKIALCVWNFFDAVKARWPRAWDSDDRGAMIARTNGYMAFMRFLRRKLEELGRESITRDEASNLLEMIVLTEDDFIVQTFASGTSGEARMFRSLQAGRLVE